jgi:hypothetical protein
MIFSFSPSETRILVLQLDKISFRCIHLFLLVLYPALWHTQPVSHVVFTIIPFRSAFQFYGGFGEIQFVNPSLSSLNFSTTRDHCHVMHRDTYQVRIAY